MPTQSTVTLNDGNMIPQFGLGVFQTPPDETAAIVQTAIKAGYRHIDTAKAYANESGVGEGIRRSGVARGDVFVTTKLWNEDQGYDATLAAADRSLAELGSDYLDLYLIHWPSPHRGLYLDSWRALVRLKEEGRVRSIGVSNFTAEHLDRIIAETGVTPAVNQVELHPRFQQAALRDVHGRLGIATESWSPLGRGVSEGMSSGNLRGNGVIEDPVITGIAGKHGKSPGQVIIRWHLDTGLIVIPKSVRAERLRENIDVFDFTLDADDLSAIAALDISDGRIGPNPMTATF